MQTMPASPPATLQPQPQQQVQSEIRPATTTTTLVLNPATGTTTTLNHPVNLTPKPNNNPATRGQYSIFYCIFFFISPERTTSVIHIPLSHALCTYLIE